MFYVYTLDGFWLADDEQKKTSFFTEAAEFADAKLAQDIGVRQFGTGEFYVFSLMPEQ